MGECNLKAMTFEENKHVQLDILKDVASFCERNGLEYFLAYGTLIGAIRHKGFIPWDDDIDIQMPRESYDRFIELYTQEKAEIKSYYRLINPYDDIARHSMVKVVDSRTVKIETGISYQSEHLGIDIDVFPIDGMPKNTIVYAIWYKALFVLYSLAYMKNLDYQSGGLKRRFWGRIAKYFPLKRKTLLNLAKKLHTMYSLDDAFFAGTMEMPFNSKKNRVEKKLFGNVLYVEFEGISFRCPLGYDSVLKSLYGDYMQLPPVEKQITHHTNNVFWKEDYEI